MNETMPTGYELAHRQAESLFRSVFPEVGMTVREGQIELCHTMLDALYNKEVALCDAGVGLGKTYAYLAAAVLWMQQRPLPLRRPVVISTASVTLQEAILEKYIPFLSSVLIQNGYINEPIQTVLRKGKGRYVCDLRLLHRQREVAQRGEKFARRLRVLQEAGRCLDLDRIQGLSGYDRQHICVPERCGRDCAARNRCRYRRYLNQAEQGSIQFQVCNHNYLLADAAHRLSGWNPLLLDYGALILDEAHKLPEANRQMQTRSLTVQGLQALANRLARENLVHEAQQLRRDAEYLAEAFAAAQESEKDGAPYALTLQPEQRSALEQLARHLEGCLEENGGKLSEQTRREILPTKNLARRFLVQEDEIRYAEYTTGVDTPERLLALHGVPKDLPQCLARALWQQEKPTVLTSGTLAAGDGFANTVRQLGLTNGSSLRTLRVPSPFDYRRNCLLVFPSRPDLPRQKENNERETAEQIRQLVVAAQGHTLVLFTAYEQMGRVFELLKGTLEFPVLQARRGSQAAVEQFKNCENAVLLAGGPCWEGMDFPGDAVSLLVIVRLPFPVPDPVREARRAGYPDLGGYIRAEIVPEMQQRLRQGFGRAIRTETDSCAVAILDPRAAPGGRYHRAVLDALPDGIPVTTEINEIQTFLRAHKGPEYFLPTFEVNPKTTDST